METDNICIYCHKAIEKGRAMSMKKIGKKYIYWHYVCYTKEAKELIEMTTKAKNELYKYLLSCFPNPEGWALEVLRSIEHEHV